jgi:2,5-dioxopentanoate dehydrogenase
MTTELIGKSFIGAARGQGTTPAGQAIQASTGLPLEPVYHAATEQEIDRALALAAEAFPAYSALSGAQRAVFLREIAAQIEAVVEDVVARGPLETALPEARLRGETGRTTGQLRMFAALLEEGSWVQARIEHAQPDRAPVPKVDLRSMYRPLGPVAVFCASNFPMAFSVAGGDTASALAAGCPVIVIAHEAHPGVAEIVAGAVRRAVEKTGLPEGVFSVLFGGGRTVGVKVVSDPVIQAVGFTGSRAGGTALMKIASERKQPIPVYAEMSSINPVILLPGALARGEKALAEGFFGSLTMGVGQFCVNPGLVFLPTGAGEEFLAHLKELVTAAPAGTMLHAGISCNYGKLNEEYAKLPGVSVLAASTQAAGTNQALPVIYTVGIQDYLADERLQAEIFGPTTVIVRGSVEEILAAIPHLEGQLTGTIHATEEELAANQALLHALEKRVGRLVFNGFPTGVEVCHSMIHGGPYPSTSDGRSTSVGTLAIERYTRGVCYQSFPQSLLPAELQESNPLGIMRLVDGVYTR